MVRIGKELQDGLLQLVTATICRDYLCIVRQWGDSVTPARRRMLFAKESVLEPIKFLTTCYSLPGNEMWGKNWTAASFEEPGQFTVKILRENITFNQYLIAVFWGQNHLISNLVISDTVVILSSSLSRGSWYLQNYQEWVLNGAVICNELLSTTVHEILAKYTCSEYLQVGKQMLFLVAPLGRPCLKSPQQTK